MTTSVSGGRTCETCRKRAGEQRIQKWVKIGRVLHLVDQKKANHKTASVCGLHVP